MRILLNIDPDGVEGSKPDLYDNSPVETMVIPGALANLFLDGEAGLVVTKAGVQGFLWDQRPEFAELKPEV